MATNTTWISLAKAAVALDASPKSLRTRLERAARKSPDGVVEANVDGLRARKWGRIWKVQLGSWG